MSKFANRQPTARGAIGGNGDAAPSYAGGAGYLYDAQSELFLLAAQNMVSETMFYETADDRDDRYVALIEECVRQDPAWVAGFVPYLRNEMNMRSAAIVMAAEYVNAEGPNGRAVVRDALQRPDEPAEMLAYWYTQRGRFLPAAIKRGVADACQRLYTESASLRYDGNDKRWRFGDVIELVHPKPTAPWQSELFRYCLDQRHHRDMRNVEMELLPTISADILLRTMPEADRRRALDGEMWRSAGWSWERLSGWLPGGMDKPAWEAVIPHMGYMALLRNLRNFDAAGIGDKAVEYVTNVLTSREQIAQSRQFPFRFYSAWCEMRNMRWANVLETALELSLTNVPRLRGATLILVDCSGSMDARMSARSDRTRRELAALFGLALAKTADNPTVVRYGAKHVRWHDVDRPTLLGMRGFDENMGATYTFTTLRETYAGHDRVIILTDEQAHDAGQFTLPECPIYTFNLGGYRPGHLPVGDNANHYTIGGLNDAAFRLLPMLEGQREGRWPWLTRAGAHSGETMATSTTGAARGPVPAHATTKVGKQAMRERGGDE